MYLFPSIRTHLVIFAQGISLISLLDKIKFPEGSFYCQSWVQSKLLSSMERPIYDKDHCIKMKDSL